MAYLGWIEQAGRLSVWFAGGWLALGLASPGHASVCSPGGGHPVVRFETVVGHFDVELCHEDVPETVQNFLSYVDDGSYTDTGFIHRVLSGAGGSTGVIQGGGFYIESTPGGDVIAQVVTRAPITLDATLTNTLGAIAMARTIEPHSATSGWFINTKDNSGPYDGEYAAFGEVIAGLDVVLDIGAMDLYQFGPFDSVPSDDGSRLITVTAVTQLPEPGMALQLGAVLAALGLLARRRRAT